MKPELSKILIERGIIREKTIVEAYHLTRGLSCTNNSRVLDEFAIIRAKKRGEDIVFDAYTRDNVMKEILAEDVISVDGMDEPRLAKAFMLSTEGEKIAEGKRRGRKPKGYVEAETYQEQVDKAHAITKLLEFGWSEERVAEKYNITIEELDRILMILDPNNDEYFGEDDEDDDDEFYGEF